MRDQEFSSPGREFAPPRAEFSRPRTEFAPPGREHTAQGREFEQTSASQAKAKKRRLSPLMLTAAAVTTAVVTISGFDNDPKLLLSMEERAALNDLTVALENMDIDRLAQLAEDPALYELVSETLIDFYKTEVPDAVNYSIYTAPTYSDGTQTSCSNHFSYDGTHAYVHHSDRFNHMGFYYDMFYPADSDVPETSSVSFDLESPYDIHRDDPYQFYSFHRYTNKDDGVVSWSYEDSICREIFLGIASDGIRHYEGNVALEGIRYDVSRSDSSFQMTVMEGSCLAIQEDTPAEWENYEFAYYQNYLENGTVSTYYDYGDGWVLDNVVEIRDGYSYVDGVRNENAYHEYYF